MNQTLKHSGRSGPFDLDLSIATFDRATRLAKALFDCADSTITLVQDGVVWRSRDPQGRLSQAHPGANAVILRGETVWVEDARGDPLFTDDPLVTGPPYLRSYVGAPIRLKDGSTPGVLCILDTKIQPFDPVKAARLRDLADLVADEWVRAQVAKTKAQLHRERKATMARFYSIVDAVPVALVITDHQLNVVGCSPRWASQMGLKDETIVGQPLELAIPASFARWREHFEQALRGESVAIERERQTTSDGATIWTSVEIAPWRGPDGEIGGAIVASHDVTHMVTASDAAARSEQRLTLAMEMADIHVWEMDYANRTLVNAGAEDSFFDEPKTFEELNQDIYATVDPRDRPEVEEAWRRHEDDGVPYRPEYRVVRQDGKEVWASQASQLIYNTSGKPIRLIGAMQNITQRKMAEAALLRAKDEAEAASRAKTAFLATMSHEIRTPLNGVLGMAQAMAAEELNPKQRQRLEIIRTSGESLLTILNNILDLSKIEAGKFDVEETQFDLVTLVESAKDAFGAVAFHKGLALTVGVEPAVRGIYRGDSTRILQILHNLVSNALKFTETGEVHIGLTLHDRSVAFAIADTGIGIAPDSLARLFQKFEQVDASPTRRHGGTGLGLAICRELAEALGGSVTVSSVVGQGSSFTVILPLARIGEERTIEDERPEEPVAAVGGLRVLAAEDNTVNQLVLKTLLNQAGVDPFIVSDGYEAVAAWQEREWDVILMDVQMPVLDGPSATRRIRELEAVSMRLRTPILALTANAMSHQIPDYLDAGMDGFIAKPINISQLFQAIESALGAPDPEVSIAAA